MPARNLCCLPFVILCAAAAAALASIGTPSCVLGWVEIDLYLDPWGAAASGERSAALPAHLWPASLTMLLRMKYERCVV